MSGLQLGLHLLFSQERLFGASLCFCLLGAKSILSAQDVLQAQGASGSGSLNISHRSDKNCRPCMVNRTLTFAIRVVSFRKTKNDTYSHNLGHSGAYRVGSPLCPGMFRRSWALNSNLSLVFVVAISVNLSFGGAGNASPHNGVDLHSPLVEHSTDVASDTFEAVHDHWGLSLNHGEGWEVRCLLRPPTRTRRQSLERRL